VKKVVLDTNVTISALFWEGNPRKIYDLVHQGKLIMLLSDDMEKEFIRVLGYEKFGLSPQEVMPFLRNLRTHARHMETKSKISVVIADPTDNIFLECAMDGGANFIISGDRHLLDIEVYKGIKIVRAGEFLLKEGLSGEEQDK
jgi:putative PIN family toxin of toxin-antitoxin system